MPIYLLESPDLNSSKLMPYIKIGDFSQAYIDDEEILKIHIHLGGTFKPFDSIRSMNEYLSEQKNITLQEYFQDLLHVR